MRRLLIALLLAASPAVAKDVAVAHSAGFRLVLTDEPCAAVFKKLIRPDWEYPTNRAVVVIEDRSAQESYGKEALEACYSNTPDGVTVLDEFGMGPNGPIPRELFLPPGSPRPERKPDA